MYTLEGACEDGNNVASHQISSPSCPGPCSSHCVMVHQIAHAAHMHSASGADLHG